MLKRQPMDLISTTNTTTDLDKTAGAKVVKWKKRAYAAWTLFVILLVLNVLQYFNLLGILYISASQIESKYLWVFAIGFLAQMVKGILGLGYGVTATICLMSLGAPVAAIGSSINSAKVFASASIAWSYYKSGKLNKMLLFKATVLPGIIGAVIGAALLGIFGEKSGESIKPIIAMYSMFLGITILKKAFTRRIQKEKVKRIGLIAGIGGFLDSFGGGGWGPLVTSGLIAKGRNPHYVIGSMSLTEFFVTIASSITFFLVIGLKYWQIMLALLVGGLIATPISVRLAGRIPVRWLFMGVGCMVIFWSFRILSKFLF